MEVGIATLYALHVLFGIAWFGGAIFSLLVLSPALSGLSVAAMQEVNPRIGMYASRVMPVAAAGTILLGIVTAIVLGHFRSLGDVIESPYGITALVALALAVALHEFARLVLASRVQRMAVSPPEQKPALLARVKQAILIEQAGFVAILTCMVLLRFGL